MAMTAFDVSQDDGGLEAASTVLELLMALFRSRMKNENKVTLEPSVTGYFHGNDRLRCVSG